MSGTISLLLVVQSQFFAEWCQISTLTGNGRTTLPYGQALPLLAAIAFFDGKCRPRGRHVEAPEKPVAALLLTVIKMTQRCPRQRDVLPPLRPSTKGLVLASLLWV